MAARSGPRGGGVHLTSSPVDWYAARAAGIVAYLLLSGVVLLGLTMAGKRTLRLWPQFTIEDVHRFGGLLVGAFISIHVVAIAIDSWLPFSIPSLLIPLLSGYRPIWVGLGIAAAELLLALAVTNHYRRRLPERFWRRAHYLNFAVWGAATLHGVGSGTDRSSPWFLAMYALAVSAVGAAIVWRLLRRRAPAWVIRLAPIAALTVTALVLGLGAGPLRFHPKPWNASRFDELLTGQIIRTNGITRGIVSMSGEGKGTQHLLVRADLLFKPGRVLRTAFQLEYLPSGTMCWGEVSNVQNFGFSAACRLPGGARRLVSTHWDSSGTSELANGTISMRPNPAAP
jgi:sulfoxide reductase heme-binding subunit YedZ